MIFTKWGREALRRVLAETADKTKNPFCTEGEKLYMKFDRIDIRKGPLDEFGRESKEAVMYYSGVALYTLSIENCGPDDTVSLAGLEGRMSVSITTD